MEIQRGSSCTFEEAIPVAKRLAKHPIFGSQMKPVISRDALHAAGLAGIFQIEGLTPEHFSRLCEDSEPSPRQVAIELLSIPINEDVFEKTEESEIGAPEPPLLDQTKDAVQIEICMVCCDELPAQSMYGGLSFTKRCECDAKCCLHCLKHW